MCDNLTPISNESVIVYKIVAKKLEEESYYSIAMGFKYPKSAGKVPKVKIQHCLRFFNQNILGKGSSAYSYQMVGRTTGFTHREHAEHLATKIRHSRYNSDFDIYKIIVVKVKLTDGLMSGTYCNRPIVVGKHIEWLE